MTFIGTEFAMNKKILLSLISALIIIWACNVAGKEPSVAGTFYPADRKELQETVDTYLSKAKRIPGEGSIIALISPHAGYR